MTPGPLPSRNRRTISPGSDPTRRLRLGFTVAELMVVVLIVGVLVATLFPNYMDQVYRAKRTESLVALQAIHEGQQFHFANENEYSDSFDEIGFDLEGGTLRPDGAYEGAIYTYTLSRWDVGDQVNANFRATATGDLDSSDATLDIVIIENALTVN